MSSPEDFIFRVLCVDDNSTLLTVLKTGLESYGLEVVTASHGIDALARYEALSGNFGAIVTDNDMPQMNGLDFVRTVRKIGFKGRIVVMSGNFKAENLRAYQEHAISGFFHKPFETGLLAAMLLRGDK